MTSPFSSGFSLGFEGLDQQSTINIVAHGFSATDPIMFGNLVGGDGLEENVTYYVATEGLLADSFHVSPNADGSGVVSFTTNITDGVIISPDTYELVSDGLMDPPTVPDAPSSPTVTSDLLDSIIRLKVTL